MALNRYRKIIFISVLVVFIVLMYEELIHLLIELLHVLFESVEYTLDLVIEHLFETGTHETQVIVFYILVPAVFYAVYELCRLSFYKYRKLKRNLYQQKIKTLAQWQALSIFKKIVWWLFLIAIIGCGLFWGLM